MAFIPIYLFIVSLVASEELLVGGKVTLKLKSTCTVIKYRQNFKPISVKLDFSEMIDNFIITDSSYETCTEGCDINSLFCVSN